jgi:hypothetical protein
MHEQPEFLEILQEKYPGVRLKQLSEHQLKRLRTAFRQRVHQMADEYTSIVRFQQRAIPKQQSVLVPDERTGQQETRLERSIARDLAMLKKLQAARVSEK